MRRRLRHAAQGSKPRLHAMTRHKTPTIRALRPQDCDAAADVIYAAASQAYDFMVWSHTRDSVRHWFGKTAADWTAVWLTVQDGRVVGVLCLKDDFIDQLFVDPAHQGQGLGSNLLMTAIAACPGALSLRVFEGNQGARAFYERHGFDAVARGLSDDEGEPDLLYRRPAPSAG